MTQNGRVAWREGMFLRPQHFQQQDRHVASVMAAHLRAVRPYPWGVIELKLDTDLAALGKFGIQRLVGLMPDGTSFAMPDDMPAPPPIDIPSDARDLIVHLTLPAMQDGGVVFRVEGEHGADAARFIVGDETISDVFSEERSREPIEVARPNMQFGISREQVQGRVTVALARVREWRNGIVSFDDRHIPPMLDIRGHARLHGFLSDIIGRTGQRVEELSLRAVEATEGGSDTFASFLLLMALNRWKAQLDHLASLPHVHPERLYEVFVSMAGELGTLTRADRRPLPFLAYDHTQLQLIFEPVVEALQAALSAVFDRAAAQLPLQQAGPGIYTSRIIDHNLFKSGHFYLAVRARMPLDEIRARFPAVAKIGAVQKMRQIVDSALAGIPLAHAPVLPPQLRTLSGYVYFELDRSVADWADFTTSPALGLHVAGDWPDLALELWWVKPGAR